MSHVGFSASNFFDTAWQILKIVYVIKSTKPQATVKTEYDFYDIITIH